MDSAALPVVPCPLEQRTAALKSLHASLPEDLRPALVQMLDAMRGQGDAALDGLLVAPDGDQLAAVWAQLLPGHSAMVWPPGEPSPVATALVREAGRFLDRSNVVIAQVLLSPSTPEPAKLLAECDYHHLVDLQYLVVEKSLFPSAEPVAPLCFEPAAGEQADRLCRVVELTYQDTCDCPAVGGVRTMPDVLASYRATGRYDRNLWFFVQHEDRDAGVLILAEHPPNPHWELVYMGVVPAARGNGFGWQIAQHALWQAGQGGAERLVLAVDQANQPALAMYARVGFVGWDNRRVYARLAGGAALPD